MLHGINFSKINADYKLVTDLLTIVIKLQRSSHAQSVIATVLEFENKINEILEMIYPNNDDTELLLFKQSLLQMKVHITRLKSQLK